MRTSDLISGSLIVLFGFVMIFIIVPIQISSSGEYGIDPKFFPVTLLWLVVVMGVLLVLTRLPTPPDPPDIEPLLDKHNWLFIGAATAFLVAAFVAIQTFGFLTAGAIMTALLVYALGGRGRSWIELVAIAVIAPTAIYYTLYHLFSVRLPAGVLFP